MKSAIGTEISSLLGKINETQSLCQDLTERLDGSVEQLTTTLNTSVSDTQHKIEQLSEEQRTTAAAAQQLGQQMNTTRQELLASATRVKQCEQVPSQPVVELLNGSV